MIYYLINTMIELRKTIFIFLLITSSIDASESKTQMEQSNLSKNIFYHKYKEIKNVKVFLIYESAEEKIITVNFNNNGQVISKTTYRLQSNERKFLHDETCTTNDCYWYLD